MEKTRTGQPVIGYTGEMNDKAGMTRSVGHHHEITDSESAWESELIR